MNADALWNDDPERAELERKKALLKRLKNDRRYYISKFLKIKTRDSRIIYLDPNEAQNRFLLMVEGQEKAGKPVRGVCLKPRRVGMSTGIQAMMFQRAATHSNINGLTVAHDLDSTQELFEMDGLFYDELPEDIRPLKRFCVDQETECLTREGWKHWDKLFKTDQIYTLNPETGLGEWHNPTTIYANFYKGPMIDWQGEDVDALFTPEHKWLLTTYKRRRRQAGIGYRRGKRGFSPRYGFYTHDHAPYEGLIPLACPVAGDGLNLRLEFLALLAWVVTEGTFYRSEVRISQSPDVNPDHIEEIKAVLDILGYEYSQKTYGPYLNKAAMCLFRIKRKGAALIRQHLPEKRFRWSEIARLSSLEAKVIVQTIRSGDGRRNGHATIWTADKLLADQYQAIAALAGIHAKILPGAPQRKNRRRALRQYGDLIDVSLSKVDVAWISHFEKRTVPYSGIIWCPDVPTHTWLARREGKVYITGNSNRKEIVFENPDEVSRRVYPGLRSKLRVATSSDEELGRSKEIHLLHCSEVGFWDKADTTMLSLCNAVSGNPHTMIFKESTPNGVGNYFYKEYKLAKSGQSDYFAYFMAWFEFHAHQKALLVPVEEFEDSINDEEEKLREKYSLTLEQLNWRRWAIRELCGGDKEKFNQEYPADDVSCFLLSGRHYFDGELIQKLLMGNLYEPAFRGNLVPSRNILGFNLEPNDKGFLKIWKPPAMGRRYIIGGDVAEGLEHGDFSTAPVHDWETFDLCASWHGHIASDLFGDELANLGNLYNRALIACEDNIGTPNKRLLRLGYPHLFYRQELDDRVKRRTQKLGWLTTHITKPVMLNDLQQLLRDGAEIPDQELVDEIATFIYKSDGSLGGESGCFDDRVVGSAIAAAVRNSWGINRFFPKS